VDCPHGFASARADYDDLRMAGRVREAYEVLAKFFEENCRDSLVIRSEGRV
jgi:hypothetical protein